MNPFVVQICYTQHYTGSVIITARDLTHAKELADSTIDPPDVLNLELMHSDLLVKRVVEADDAVVSAFDEARERELVQR